MKSIFLLFTPGPIIGLSFALFTIFGISGCGAKDQVSRHQKKDTLGIYEDQIRRMEKLIPNSLFNEDHLAIWRSGSILYSEYLSVLIIEKKQLKDKQLLCYYMSFDSDKPSNFRNWKFSNVYEVTLENIPFTFPPTDKIHIEDLDTLSYIHGEGIESNNYFMTDFESDTIYPVSRRYNSGYCKHIAKLFDQISRRERVQTFVLTNDSIPYSAVGRILSSSDEGYIIKEDREVNSLQRRYGDK